jgi:hypothetical protein
MRIGKDGLEEYFAGKKKNGIFFVDMWDLHLPSILPIVYLNESKLIVFLILIKCP